MSTKRMVLNMGWSFLGYAVTTLFGFLLLPSLLRHLTPEPYALYSLIGIISGYAPLLTLGAGLTTTKFVAQFRGARNSHGLRDTIRFAIALHLGGGLLAALLVWGIGPSLAISFFHNPDPLRPYAWTLCGSAAATALLLCLFQLMISLLQGFNRFGWANLFFTLKSTLPLLGSVWLLHRGGTLVHLAWWHPICHLGLVLGCAATMWRITAASQPLLSPSPQTPDTRAPTPWRQMRHYCAHTLMSQIGWAGTFQLDKLFIGRMLPLSSLTFYLIPFSLAQSIGLLFASMTGTLLPIASELQSSAREEEIRKLYLRATRLILWLAVPAFTGAFLLAPEGLSLWLGPEFARNSTGPLRWLLAGQLLFLAYSVPAALCTGLGKPQYPNYFLLANALCSWVLWSFLIPRNRIVGAAMGTSLAFGLTVPYFIHCIHSSLLHITWTDYLREGWAGALKTALGWYIGLSIWKPHIHTWPGLFLALGIGMLISALAFPWVWKGPEKEFLRNLLRR